MSDTIKGVCFLLKNGKEDCYDPVDIEDPYDFKKSKDCFNINNGAYNYVVWVDEVESFRAYALGEDDERIYD